jgi:hypothetical protein
MPADEAIHSPATTSTDYNVMKPYWDKVDAVLGGIDTMIEAGDKYLPKFPGEWADLYSLRLNTAVLTNIYKDVAENLAQKPFSKKARMKEGTNKDVEDLAEDIDSRGNNLHVFLAETFWKGINNAIDWIFVDKMPMRPGVTQAEERLAGARPYWVHVPATRMLAVYSDMIEGKEQIVHARIHEPIIRRNGWTEEFINRVRVLDRPYDPDTKKYGDAVWQLWEEKKTVGPGGTITDKAVWTEVDKGTIAIKVIALVPFITGRRHGTSWVFDPPMREALNSQVDHYQQENGKKDARVMTAYPMLSGSGVSEPLDDKTGQPKRVPVGPRSVLFAPLVDGKAGSWQWIEPQATSLAWLSSELKAKEDQIRELGRQPLTAQSGNLTVIMAGVAAAKGNSAVQAWTWALKDAAEQAFIYTSMYMGGSEEPEVVIHTDFPVEGTAEKAPDIILKLREMREISRQAMFNELMRFSLISPDYDPKEDEELLAEEEPEDPTAEDVAGALGETNPDGTPLTPEQKAALKQRQRMRVVK